MAGITAWVFMDGPAATRTWPLTKPPKARISDRHVLNPARARDEYCPQLCDFNPTRGPVEQLDADIALDLLDGFGQCRGRDVQLKSGGTERLTVRHRSPQMTHLDIRILRVIYDFIRVKIIINILNNPSPWPQGGLNQ